MPDWLLVSTIGIVDPERSVASQRAYFATFFDQHLRGEHQEVLEGPSRRHPDVDFVR